MRNHTTVFVGLDVHKESRVPRARQAHRRITALR